MARRRASAVLRFSSLGDVLLAAHMPGFLKREDPDRRVLFVTKGRYAELLRGHPHLDRVYALCERDAPLPQIEAWVGATVGDLIDALRRDEVDEIVDLHGNWRSLRLRSAFPKARIRRAPKHALRRRLWVHARWLRPEPVPPLLHTYRALCGLGPEAPDPWLRRGLSEMELSRGRERAGEEALSRGFILIGAGARWETKRWPAASFLEFARRVERERGLVARFAVEPGARDASEIISMLGPHGIEPLSLPFRELAAVAAHARAIVSNDSAVLHLGPSLGVPVLGIFGGTVPEFGFARQGSRDEVAEIRLACRPCSVHGRSRCPLGHHACMNDLHPDLAYSALERALTGSPAPAEAAIASGS